MYPFIRDRDVVTVAPLGGRPPLVGDVVAIIHPINGRLVIHRVIRRRHSGWLIRGDNCQEVDGVVTIEDILGYVISIERQGRQVRLGLGGGARAGRCSGPGPGGSRGSGTGLGAGLYYLIGILSAHDLLLPLRKTVYLSLRSIRAVCNRVRC